MAFKIPHVLRYEIQHRLESLGIGASGMGSRQWMNERPLLVASVAGVSVVSLILALTWALWPASDAPRVRAKTVWFYDVNTGKLFEGSPKNAGPVAAPSGPATNGEPAGFRAHVYSYVLDPNEAELFVGFLERPDPEAPTECSASDRSDWGKWIEGHLIRRPGDKKWVRAASPEGQAILKGQIQPNKRGQTPIYQVPHSKE
jgi:hypothetical protein